MSFISGSTALTICDLSAPVPEDYLSRLAAYSAPRLGDVKTDPALGFAGWRHYEAPVDETDAICGGHLHIQLVRAERKIPAPLLQDAVRRQVEIWKRENDTASCPSKERKRIKADVIERNLMKMPPTVSSIPIAIDLKSRRCYIGSASPKAVDMAIALLFKALGVEAVPLDPERIVKRTFADVAGSHELPILSIAGAKAEDPTPRRDFLTWLWYHAEERGGVLNAEYSGRLGITANGKFECMIEAPFTFATPGEAKGAAESSVKKGGCPTVAAEAKAALLAGKKLKKAVVAIVRGQAIWRGTFDADKFAFGGLTLPEGEEMETNSMFEERMRSLGVLADALTEYVNRYGRDVLMQSSGLLAAKLGDWAKNRESY